MIGDLFDISFNGFKKFMPFPYAFEREKWEGLTNRKLLIEEGEKYLDFSWPTINGSDWFKYTKTGNRKDFEDKYFARRKALIILVTAECAEYRGRFLEEIINGIMLICEESGWQLPAHNSYVRDSKTYPLPNTRKPVLDLFACETGEILAMIYYLFKSELDLISPEIANRIEAELDYRIIQPYINNWFWWMGDKPTCNWTVWCTQNVLLTAFLICNSEKELLSVVKKAVSGIDSFLEDYGEDGCCDEGALYYRHAGLCLFGALDILDKVCPNIFTKVWQEKKIKNIALYILNVHAADKYYINFADCAATPGRCGVREYLFGKRCGLDNLCNFAAEEYSSTTDDDFKDISGEINLYYRMLDIFNHDEISRYIKNEVVYKDIYYKSTGLFIARDSQFCLAVKAGGNNDSHNHNDTGSVILYKNGKPFLIDLGVESYTAKTFSKDRYDIWTMQSSWHNLPEFDGIMQMPGENYRAVDIETSFDEDICKISMELKNAWPEKSRLSSYIREVVFTKEESIYIKDYGRGTYKEGVLNIIVCEKPSYNRSILYIENLGKIKINSDCDDVHMEEVEIIDGRLKKTWPDKIYRVRIKFYNQIELYIK